MLFHSGSTPGVYVRTGAASNKWKIHIQGGGWCTSIADCANRAKSLLGCVYMFRVRALVFACSVCHLHVPLVHLGTYVRLCLCRSSTFFTPWLSEYWKPEGAGFYGLMDVCFDPLSTSIHFFARAGVVVSAVETLSCLAWHYLLAFYMFFSKFLLCCFTDGIPRHSY